MLINHLSSNEYHLQLWTNISCKAQSTLAKFPPPSKVHCFQLVIIISNCYNHFELAPSYQLKLLHFLLQNNHSIFRSKLQVYLRKFIYSFKIYFKIKFNFLSKY